MSKKPCKNQNQDQETLYHKYASAIERYTTKELNTENGGTGYIPNEKVKAMRDSLMANLCKIDCIYNFTQNRNKDDRMIHINESLDDFNHNLSKSLKLFEKINFDQHIDQITGK